MTFTSDPIHLLASADLLLWIADLLRPSSRSGDWEADAETLEQLARCCIAETAWNGMRLSALQDEFASTPQEIVRAEHARLFEGATTCPINETAYVRRDKGVILADLMGFYRAFGFTTSRDSGEKPDHILAELEFLSVLLVMLAQAKIDRNEERATVTEKALCDFCGDHLGEWIESFCDRLATTASVPAYRQSADLLRVVWETLRKRFGLECSDPQISAHPKEASESPYECGLCDEQSIKPRTSSSP